MKRNKKKEKEVKELLNRIMFRDFENMYIMAKGLEIIVNGFIKNQERKGKKNGRKQISL